MKNQMNKTYLLIDPRDQNPEGTVELTLDDFVDAGGNLAALRGEAGGGQTILTLFAQLTLPAARLN